MNPRFRVDSSRTAARLLTAGLALALAACAGARAQSRQLVADRSLPKPPVVLVQPFAVDPDDVLLDSLGPELVRGEAATSEKVKHGRQVARTFADKLVAKLRDKGIPAKRAGHDAQPQHRALVVKGQFLTIDEGSREARMIIGFGAGTQRVRVRAQVYQVTEHGLRRIDEGTGEAHGDSMPGMAVPVGVGAATGRVATTAVISGGMNVVSEVTGTLDARLDDLADQVAERAVEFYVRQGWM